MHNRRPYIHNNRLLLTKSCILLQNRFTSFLKANTFHTREHACTYKYVEYKNNGGTWYLSHWNLTFQSII